MKKILPYILIFLVVVQFFAPFTVGIGKKDGVKIGSNKAEAMNYFFTGNGTLPIGFTVTPQANDTSIRITVTVAWPEKTWLSSESVYIMKLSKTQNENDPAKTIYDQTEKVSFTDNANGTQTGYVDFTGLNPLTPYKFDVIGTQSKESIFQTAYNLSSTAWSLVSAGYLDFGYANNNGLAKNPTPYEITTAAKGTTTFQQQTVANATIKNDELLLPVCTLMSTSTWEGCIGRFVYWGIFKPTSMVFALTGKLLDISIDYSTKDTSYRSPFVLEGWKVVRDFCNLFFIFVLLYIAFGTILSLNGVKTKEMIVNVVIIGLLINFSLFTTQVIIDASNILTRVFYNSNTIKVGPKVNDVIQDQRGSMGEIKLSEAIVTKINPQKLILEADKASVIQTNQTISASNSASDTSGGISASTFLLVSVLASVVNIVGLITFLMCSLIFISRVIGLWLAMILAPLVFFTYTVPQLQDMEMIGWKKWWPETIKLAFLAPIFMFFMYLIIKFLDSGLGLAINDTKGGLDFLLGIFVPFIFIMILLTKSKDIAKTMSGKIGQTMTDGMAKVGGFVIGAGLGAATGGAAMAMRGTVGRLGNKLATSEWASTHGAVGRTFGNLGKWTGSKSFDARNTTLGAAAGKGLGIDTSAKGIGMGVKEGGYAKHLSDKVEKRQKRAKELEVHENEPLKQALNKTEMDLQSLLNANKKELDSLDKTIEIRRQALTDANAQYGAGSTEAKTAGYDLQNAKRRKKALKDGTDYTGDLDSVGVATTTNAKSYAGVAATGMYTYVDSNGATQTVRRTINNMETYEVKNRKADIEDENRERKGNYARAKASWGGRANKEAEHKIIMETKLDSGTKT